MVRDPFKLPDELTKGSDGAIIPLRLPKELEKVKLKAGELKKLPETSLADSTPVILGTNITVKLELVTPVSASIAWTRLEIEATLSVKF